MQTQWSFAVLLALAGCAGRARPVEFQGHPAERIAAPDEVLEASANPRDAERLGRLFVRCRPLAASESFSERRLLDVDCSEKRLRRLLHEAAAEQGGNVLAELECRQSSAISCQAILARQSSRVTSAPLVAEAADVHGELGAWVLVSYEAHDARTSRPARAEQNVGEVGISSPAHVALGNLEVRCEECSELSAREALRIAAGRLGASDVVGVRCLDQGKAQYCVAEAAVWERDAAP